jgi:hypothetical protein
VVPRAGLSPRCAAMAEGTPATPVAPHKKSKHTNGATRARSRRWVCNGARASVTCPIARAGVLIAHELSRNDRCVSTSAAWLSGCDPLCINFIHGPYIPALKALRQATNLCSGPYSVHVVTSPPCQLTKWSSAAREASQLQRRVRQQSLTLPNAGCRENQRNSGSKRPNWNPTALEKPRKIEAGDHIVC